MNFLDIHAHFADEGYDLPAEWERIRAASVTTVVLAGDTLAHSIAHRDFAASHDGAYFTAGIHPSDAACFSDGTADALRALFSHPKCVAVGEAGLDYHYPAPARAVQKAAFIRQIELAEEADLPLQIHARDCAADMLALLTDMRAHLKQGFLLHCYSQGAEMLPAFAALGAYFSFGGVACFKNAKKVWESVRACPADRILSETDSPYLSPFRGEKNTPANIPVIVAALARLRGETEETLAANILQNAKRLFAKIG